MDGSDFVLTGSAAISVLSALHVGILALSGWILLLNAAVAFQLLEYVQTSASSLQISHLPDIPGTAPYHPF